MAYEDINVAADPVAREDMVTKSGQLGVPVFDVDGQIIVGYNQQLLVKVIGINVDATAVAAAGADDAPSK